MRRGRNVNKIDPETIQSPCVSICAFNENDYCVGCKRSMNEIGDWHRYSAKTRVAITIELLDRHI